MIRLLWTEIDLDVIAQNMQLYERWQNQKKWQL